jgi:hypothetical protein
MMTNKLDEELALMVSDGLLYLKGVELGTDSDLNVFQPEGTENYVDVVYKEISFRIEIRRVGDEGLMRD